MYYHLSKTKGSRMVLARKGIYLMFSNITCISQGAKITTSSQMGLMPELQEIAQLTFQRNFLSQTNNIKYTEICLHQILFESVLLKLDYCSLASFIQQRIIVSSKRKLAQRKMSRTDAFDVPDWHHLSTILSPKYGFLPVGFQTALPPPSFSEGRMRQE